MEPTFQKVPEASANKYVLIRVLNSKGEDAHPNNQAAALPRCLSNYNFTSVLNLWTVHCCCSNMKNLVLKLK